MSIHVSHDAVRKRDPAGGTFKTMAEDSNTFKPTLNSKGTETTTLIDTADNKITRRLSYSSEKDVSTLEEPNMTCKVLTLQSVPDDSNSCRPSAEVDEQLSPQALNACLKTTNVMKLKEVSSEHVLSSKQHSVNNADKENTDVPSTTSTQDNTQEEDTSGQRSSKPHRKTEDNSEVMKRARDEGRVNVVFPGTVTQEGSCRFVSEILKCILYQRQQLPMTYDQLVYSQKKQQASMQDKDIVGRRPVQSADMDWRKCQQTLQELEEVLQQLEVLFSLSRVPRVLLLMGGSLILPKELYEINMEALVLAGGDQCLRVSSCLRQLFRTLFVSDLLFDSRPVRLMPTTVLALAHRDCGVGWFRPKLQFKVPTRVKNQIIALSTDPSTCEEQRAQGSDWQDYVWFQAPMTIKGIGI
ncbi:MAD2L1-binding protein isoform X2 [Etheostoma spectabile]|uniref:MAD2L1-binding protein isoform X2 n=1 Tax=Etheostoma spectabile TaxID=54343 RepID=UPI0013AE9B37|nr:MAD2L1-binding protein isoform X2 [Etheostoma spectabile]